MKVEITKSFYGFPDGEIEIYFIEGAVVDVEDSFGEMIIGKELAKPAGSKAKADKAGSNEAQ